MGLFFSDDSTQRSKFARDGFVSGWKGRERRGATIAILINFEGFFNFGVSSPFDNYHQSLSSVKNSITAVHIGKSDSVLE